MLIKIADLRAAIQIDLALRIYRLDRLGISQDRVEKRIGITQQGISYYLQKTPVLAIFVNSDLKRGFNVDQIAEKLEWPEPMYL